MLLGAKVNAHNTPQPTQLTKSHCHFFLLLFPYPSESCASDAAFVFSQKLPPQPTPQPFLDYKS